MKAVSDEELVRLYVASPDTRYVESLYRRYWGQVYARCVWITKDAEYAQDLTQDIFLQLGSKLAGFRHEARFSTWLKTIATNYALTQVGYQQRRQQRFVPITESTLEIAQEEGVAERIEQAEWTDQQVAQSLNQLSSLERQLLVLKYQDELSVGAMSRLFSLGPSAIKMRLMRSRDKFRAYYLAQVPWQVGPSRVPEVPKA